MKTKIKIIQENDKQIAKENEVNKPQFAAKPGLVKSSLQAILANHI